MPPRTIALILLLPLAAGLSAQAPPSNLTQLLESQLAGFPARTGLYVKHLGTGEEAAVRGDESFSSASVIKLAIMIRAFQLADEKSLDLNERVTIGRADLRDGSGVLQFHDLGLTPTYRDLITEMVITSDNTATDLMVRKIGGVEALNEWLVASGFTHTRMVGRGHEYPQEAADADQPRVREPDARRDHRAAVCVAGQRAVWPLHRPLHGRACEVGRDRPRPRESPHVGWASQPPDGARPSLLAGRHDAS